MQLNSEYDSSLKQTFRFFKGMKKAAYLFVFVLLANFASAQSLKKDSSDVIQFSGVVVTQDDLGEMIPLPYTSVAVQGTARGTYAEVDGFFSIAARRGDTLVFSRIGFETVKHSVSDTLESNFYSWYQIMSIDNVLLPEAVIFPWPSREHYKIEFLALDITNELRQRAEENLAEEILQRMHSAVSPDGENSFELEQAQRVAAYQYAGQYKPQKIFDVIAWSQFIKAWKNGDYKRKKKDAPKGN